MLSSVLFLACIDKIIQRFNEQWERELDHGIFAYADDIGFWSVDREDLVIGQNK